MTKRLTDEQHEKLAALAQAWASELSTSDVAQMLLDAMTDEEKLEALEKEAN